MLMVIIQAMLVTHGLLQTCYTHAHVASSDKETQKRSPYRQDNATDWTVWCSNPSSGSRAHPASNSVDTRAFSRGKAAEA